MDERFEPAMSAAYGADLEGFKRAVAADPEIVTLGSSTSHPSLLQFVAVEGGLKKIANAAGFAQVLIDAGASLDAPLVAAASVGAMDVLGVIVAAGGSIEAGAPWTPLEETLYWSHTDIGRQLVDHFGAQICSVRCAAALGELETLQIRLQPESLAQERVRFPFGEPEGTPQDVLDQALLIALKNRQLKSAEMLVAAGAKVNALPPGNHEHCTPLHHAAIMNLIGVVQWLLANGADPTILDTRFQATAAGWARHEKHEPLAELIERSMV